ncbi:MAG: methyltransferase [Myxococcales bacterium]|nr:methyltransferase [Myxococcales bacterium]
MTSPHLDCEVVLARSGATAIRDRVTGEIMHPRGPDVETAEVYLGPSRLAERLATGGEGPLVLFDVGLGAGSNALAAWRLSESRPRGPGAGRPLDIVSFEHDLSALALALDERHRAAFGLTDARAHGAASALARDGHHEAYRTRWRLCLGDLREALEAEPAGSADVVFWDPFSREVTPELWTVACLRAARRVCRDGCTLHTYSAATATRSGLVLAGFAVGADGARGESTSAAVHASDLASPLDARWLLRLSRSGAPFPTDVAPEAHEAALEAVRAAPQFR